MRNSLARNLLILYGIEIYEKYIGGDIMKRSIVIIILISAVLFGQGNISSPGRVLQKIEEASNLLEQVSSRLGENPPQLAIDYLEQAQRLIQEAHNEYDNGNMIAARNLAEQAQSLCQQALSVQREESAEIRRARRTLEQCRSLIEKLGPQITLLGDNSLVDMFGRGSELFKNARSAFDKGEAKLAYSIAKQANSLFHKISARLSGGVDAENVISIIERTGEVIAQTEDEFGDNIPSDAKALLDVANRFQKSSLDAFDRGDIVAAASMTMSARQKAQEAHKIAGGSLFPEFIKNGIEQAKSALSQIQPSADIYSEVNNLIEQAENELDKKDYRQAANLVQSAKKILGEQSSSENLTPSSESVQKAISMTDKIIDSTEPADDTSKTILGQAKDKQKQAKDDFKRGKYSEALNNTRVAKQIAEQIQ